MSQPKHPIPPQPTQHQTTPPPPQTPTRGLVLAVRLYGCETSEWTSVLDELEVLVYVKSGPAVEDAANDKWYSGILCRFNTRSRSQYSGFIRLACCVDTVVRLRPID